MRRSVYRLLGVTFDPSSIIYWGGRWFAPDRVKIGRHSIIGDHFFLDGRYGVTIGDNVSIASEVRIWTSQHDIRARDFSVIGAPVVIENWAVIGSGVTVLPGVTIGEGAVIGSGAVVAKDIPAWTTAYGVPAHPVADRPRQTYTLDTSRRAWFQ